LLARRRNWRAARTMTSRPAAAAKGTATCSPVRASWPEEVVAVPAAVVVTAATVVVVAHPGPLPLPPLPVHVWAPALKAPRPETPITLRQTTKPRHNPTLVATRLIVRT